MAFLQLIARTLIISVCLISGIGKIADLYNVFDDSLINGYSNFHAFAKSAYGVSLPLSPDLVLAYSTALLTVGGALQLICGVLYLLKVRLGGYLAMMWCIAINVMVHNPYLYKGAEREAHMDSFIQFLALLGAIYLGMLHAFDCSIPTPESPEKLKTN